jgi:hypothetical protein
MLSHSCIVIGKAMPYEGYKDYLISALVVRGGHLLFVEGSGYL